MFFEKSEIERLPDYGEVVEKDVFLKKINDYLTHKYVFEADYVYKEYVKYAEAEKLLFELYKLINKTD